MFVINSLAGGGAERVLTTILRNSSDRSKHYDLSLTLLDRDARAYEPPSWLAIDQLDCRHGFLRSLMQTMGLVRTRKPDMTVSFLTRANIVTAVTMSLVRRPFILSERVDTSAHLGTGFRSMFARAMIRLTYAKAARILTVSTGVGRQLTDQFSVPSSRILTIYNPVDIEAIGEAASHVPSIAVEPPYVVAVGRLVRNKNFALAIRAFAQARLPGRLVILGEGPEREPLRKLSQDLNIDEWVVLPGFVENPYPIIAGAEFMALSSNAEGFPNAMVEALACGVPVVATDCASGPSEILETSLDKGVDGAALGRGGLLVPPDDVTAMANAFVQMSSSRLRRSLASQAVGRAAEFSVKEAVDRYWHAIELVLAERRANKASM